MTPPTIPLYLGSSWNFSVPGRFFQETLMIPMFQGIGFETVNTLTSSVRELIKASDEAPEGAPQQEKWNKIHQTIAASDIVNILRCRIMVVVFDGTRADHNRASDIELAHSHGIPILGYRGDLRLNLCNSELTAHLQEQFLTDKSGRRIALFLKDLQMELEWWHDKLAA